MKHEVLTKRGKELENIEANYRSSMHKLGPRAALDQARAALAKYAQAHHTSDSFWYGRALARLRNGMEIEA
ncbi:MULTISPECIES: hypothetical protein [unclassified Roseobacter]|uniref:hypothetical protein n=1 Tax=unclassified Roseobacter TaxID=196798 RepID=UPI001490EDBB|nr:MULTISPECIES: hypothetical protein [unclassified Roseobacter]NNW55461.1 hypothetical protein [Roseobacter sp. HKCCD8284]NNY17298.1 hypothetical protein [Roseobacter sp. HKCCD8191]